MKEIIADVTVIGAGLTGLTTAYLLSRKGLKVKVIDKNAWAGGQIKTFKEEGFVFESGPNTGVVSYPEITELFQSLNGECELENARESAKLRFIWKGNQFHLLPSGLTKSITTPLFTLSDKIRILGEPFRAKGTNPDESVYDLAKRRLGKSFVDYAVDPFLSGVYAGNPQTLITRYALPKLYNLEQNYGSFIKGAIAKMKEPKTDRDKLATKKVFSCKGGLDYLPLTLANKIGKENVLLNAKEATITPMEQGFDTTFNFENERISIKSKNVITTVGGYSIPRLLPFIEEQQTSSISNLIYAPVMQVGVGIKNTGSLKFNGFGGLVPSCEKRDVLGILYPSACFEGRAPQDGALFSFFIGGRMHADMLNQTDEQIESMIVKDLHAMLKFPQGTTPDMIRIFRHQQAIPQYEASSGKRLEAIDNIQQQYKGLILGGNIKGGIGMADRIRQAFQLAELIK